MAIWARANTHATVRYSGAPAAPEMLSAPRGVTFLARSSPAWSPPPATCIPSWAHQLGGSGWA